MVHLCLPYDLLTEIECAVAYGSMHDFFQLSGRVTDHLTPHEPVT